MREEDLGERRRLVAKEDDEGRAAFGQDRAKCKINLRKAWRASLVFECVLQFNVCKQGGSDAGDGNRGVRAHAAGRSPVRGWL